MVTIGSFSSEEIARVRDKYPGLERISQGKLEGCLAFTATFDGVTLTDEFTVRVVALENHPHSRPVVAEIGGRTTAIAAKFGIRSLLDLHCYPNGNACVGVPQEAWRLCAAGSDARDFIDLLAVPYFYSLSFFERTGTWPWGERSHGTMGLLEYYEGGDTESSLDELGRMSAMLRKDPNWKEYFKQVKRPNGQRACPCGRTGRSGNVRPFAECHYRAWRGMQNFVAELRRAGIYRLDGL